MSKFEVEFGFSVAQFEYVHVKVNGETMEEVVSSVYSEMGNHLQACWYGLKVGLASEMERQKNALTSATPQQLIESELGGKVIEETAAPAAAPIGEKPWERPKPATKAKTDPNDPFASFR